MEVGYYRRTFTMYSTGGTVTENLAFVYWLERPRRRHLLGTHHHFQIP